MSAVAAQEWSDPDAAGRLVPVASAPPLTAVPELDHVEFDRLRFSGPGTEAGDDEDDLPDERDLPDAERWAATLVGAAVETLVGSRPAHQLIRWLSAELYASIRQHAGLAIRVQGVPATPRRARIRSVRTCPVRPGVVEATVVVHDGARVRAAAIRLESYRGRWRATALDIG